MKLNFKKVILKNFMSFKEASLELDNLGFVLVNGINNNPDDFALSNGSGKSSLLESINWALTGETIRGTKDVVRIDADETCSVELIFTVDNNSYNIIRTKDPSNLKLYINDEDKSGKGIRDTEQILADYLPDLNSQLIGSVIILGQGLPQRLSNNTPSGRKEILEKLSKSDFMLADIKQRINNRKVELSDLLREHEDLAIQLNTNVSMLTTALTTKQALLDNLQKPDEAILTNLKNEQTRLKDEISSAQQELTKTINYLDTIQRERLSYKDTLAEAITKATTEYASLQASEKNALATYNTEKALLEAELKRLNNIKDICPTCGQKIPNIIKPDTAKQQERYNYLISAIGTTESSIKQLTKCIDDVTTNKTKEFNNLDIQLATKYESAVVEKEKIIKMINNLTDNINELVTLIAKQENINDNYLNLQAEYINDIKKLTDELSELNSRILYNNKSIEDTNAHLDIVSKMMTLITRDFRGYLLMNVISFIDTKAKEYSMDLFETNKISFSLDGNNINIKYDQKDYANLSGGEKQKVDIIIQLALRDMLCKYLDFSSNILVLDEISDNLDAVGADKLFNLIATKLTDVDSIFIISHHGSELQVPVDKEILVVKDVDKISRVV